MILHEISLFENRLNFSQFAVLFSRIKPKKRFWFRSGTFLVTCSERFLRLRGPLEAWNNNRRLINMIIYDEI